MSASYFMRRPGPAHTTVDNSEELEEGSEMPLVHVELQAQLDP